MLNKYNDSYFIENGYWRLLKNEGFDLYETTIKWRELIDTIHDYYFRVEEIDGRKVNIYPIITYEMLAYVIENVTEMVDRKKIYNKKYYKSKIALPKVDIPKVDKVKLKNSYVEEKLAIHEKNYNSVKNATEIERRDAQQRYHRERYRRLKLGNKH